MNYDRAAQQYFDPPDPKERVYEVMVFITIHATDEDDAREQVRALLDPAIGDYGIDAIYDTEEDA
jgi:hypothetical protein